MPANRAITMTTTPPTNTSTDWRHTLAVIVETMRQISLQTDPQEMVRVYGQQMRQLLPLDRRVSLSRRGLVYPQFRITRSTTWADTTINPWKEKDRLPLLEGGLLASLIYGNETRVFDDLELSADDPACEYLSGHRSLLAIPMFDQGEALNMVILMEKGPGAFPGEQIPDIVWRATSLAGRPPTSS